jgi:hypothetical protein
MVIGYFNVIGIAIDKSKAYSPLVVYGNRKLAFPFFLQLMKSIAQGYLQVIQVRCQVEILQLPQRPLPNRWRQPLRLSHFIQLLRMSIGKRFDYDVNVNRNVTLVKREGSFAADYSRPKDASTD